MNLGAEDCTFDMLCWRYVLPNMLGFWKLPVVFRLGFGVICGFRVLCGGPTRTRTWDRPIMSRML
jgi:hypothetical protein